MVYQLSWLLEGVGGGKSGEACSNALLAAVSGVGAKDEMEVMLAVQMTITHHAAMRSSARLDQAKEVRPYETYGNMAVKLLRTFALQTEALAKLRRGGEQTGTS